MMGGDGFDGVTDVGEPEEVVNAAVEDFGKLNFYFITRDSLPSFILILSDYGYIINELIMLGVDISLPKREEIIQTVLNRFGAKLVDDAITIECMVADYPKAKHNLLQAMLAIDDLFYVSRPNVLSMFRDE